MLVLKKENKLCACCMETHEVWTVQVDEKMTISNTEVSYPAVYEYCHTTDEYIATEEMIRQNDIAMKDAYREAAGLLTSQEIMDIRKKYQVSQSDLAVLLGWGKKTLTRYESHQVQDMAHNDILVKIGEDPEWFLVLLERSQKKVSERAYMKYLEAAKELYARKQNSYIQRAILAQYAREKLPSNACGNTEPNFDKVAEIVNYIAANEVAALYLVKLIKMIWYSDALNYKRHGKSITGMAYKALPMGAVPIGYDQIVALHGIKYREVEFAEGTGYLFIENHEYIPHLLSDEEKASVDTVIERFRDASKKAIVKAMHEEEAYKCTEPYQIISFDYASRLSLC